MIRWAVFVSGQGSNLENVLHLEKSKALKSQKVSCVVADRVCPAIDKARKASKPVFVLSPKEEKFDQQLISFLKEYRVNRIFLLGYMKILPASFLSRWAKPIINLHPSLLPKYKGLHAIEQAFEAGDSELGPSLHDVVDDLDSGQILLQKSFPRLQDDDLQSISKKMHETEHELVQEYLLKLDKSVASEHELR